MTQSGVLDASRLKSILDAVPSPIFVFDDDVRLQEFNKAAAEFLSVDRSAVLRQRGGDVLHCIHATDVPEGCGRGPSCKQCAIRNSVNEAFRGKRVTRRRAKLEILRATGVFEFHALITASPFHHEETPLVLVVIEDLSEIAELRRLIPICCICRRVRGEAESWQRIEAYFKDHWNMDFTHGLCPECYAKERAKLEESSSVK